jgi:spermidine/putrescine transport system substrate-binding protein
MSTDFELSRRALLQRGAGLAALGLTPGLLAACGGSGGGSTAGGTSGTTAKSTGSVGGTVRYFGYQGADFIEPLEPFTKKNGIQIKSSYLTAGPEIPAKFSAGNPGFDVIQFTTAEIPFVETSGVGLQPLDLSQIPNWGNLEPFLKLTGPENFSNEKGEFVCLPTDWGALGVTYDKTKMKTPTSWAELADPSFQGKITTIDDPGSNLSLTAQILGFSSAEMTQSQLDEVSEYMEKILANCKSIAPSFGDVANLLATGEVIAAYSCWSAVGAIAAEAGNPNVVSTVDLEEGTIGFAEGWCIPEGAENTATIYALMNELLEPKVSAEAATSVLCASTAKGGQAKQPKEVAELYPAESEWKEFFDEAPLALNPPAVSDKFVTYGEMIERWTQLKNEA